MRTMCTKEMMKVGRPIAICLSPIMIPSRLPSSTIALRCLFLLASLFQMCCFSSPCQWLWKGWSTVVRARAWPSCHSYCTQNLPVWDLSPGTGSVWASGQRFVWSIIIMMYLNSCSGGKGPTSPRAHGRTSVSGSWSGLLAASYAWPLSPSTNVTHFCLAGYITLDVFKHVVPQQDSQCCLSRRMWQAVHCIKHCLSPVNWEYYPGHLLGRITLELSCHTWEF